MTFRELLFGVLGTGGRWAIRFKRDEGSGTIYVKAGHVVDAIYNNGAKKLEGMDALNGIIAISTDIRDASMHPLGKDVKQRINVDQFTLLNMLEKAEKPKNSLQEMLKEEVKVERKLTEPIKPVKQTTKPSKSEIFNILSRYFSSENITAIYLIDKNHCKAVFERKKSDTERVKSAVDDALTEILKVCKPSYLRMQFKNAFVLIVPGNPSILVVLSPESRGDFELEENSILKDIHSYLGRI